MTSHKPLMLSLAALVTTGMTAREYRRVNESERISEEINKIENVKTDVAIVSRYLFNAQRVIGIDERERMKFCNDAIAMRDCFTILKEDTVLKVIGTDAAKYFLRLAELKLRQSELKTFSWSSQSEYQIARQLSEMRRELPKEDYFHPNENNWPEIIENDKIILQEMQEELENASKNAKDALTNLKKEEIDHFLRS